MNDIISHRWNTPLIIYRKIILAYHRIRLHNTLVTAGWLEMGFLNTLSTKRQCLALSYTWRLSRYSFLPIESLFQVIYKVLWMEIEQDHRKLTRCWRPYSIRECTANCYLYLALVVVHHFWSIKVHFGQFRISIFLAS